MADGITIEFESKDVEKLLTKILKRVSNPRPLMKTLERYVHAQTMLMFRGRRPDTTGVRGQRWPKLKKSTIQQKLAMQKNGKAIASKRPLVRTGEMRDSLKVLVRSQKGFVYGSKTISQKGFPYPGIHQVGTKDGRLPARKWLFLTKQDLSQMIKTTIDYIKGRLRSGIR